MVRGGLRQWRLFEGLYGDRLLFQLGVAMAGEGLATANPATIPNRHNIYAGPIIFMLMMVVTVQLLLFLVLPGYPKRSRHAESVKESSTGRKEREVSSDLW